jgi:hypothetical protein
MGDFGYSGRARNVNEAQAEVHAAFEAVVDRNNKADPKTRRWLNAIDAFRAAYARVYPAALRQADQGAKNTSEVGTSDILDFLEADPVFDRSGYMKERLLTELKRRNLDQHDATRLRTIIIDVVQKSDRREFRHYCRVATTVDGPLFRDLLKGLECANDPDVRRRASWVLTALAKANGCTECPLSTPIGNCN